MKHPGMVAFRFWDINIIIYIFIDTLRRKTIVGVFFFIIAHTIQISENSHIVLSKLSKLS